MASNNEQPSDTLRERVDESRVKLYVLLEMDRFVLTGLLVGAVFVALVVLGALDPSPLRETLESKDPVETAFQALLTSIITGVTLVVTLNQLVLSQELGAVGEQRSRMEDAMDFRRDSEEVFDAEVAPPTPSSFLQEVVQATDQRAADLVDAVEGTGEAGLRDGVRDLADTIHGNAELVTDQLRDAEFGSFDVLSAALNYNYSWKIYETRRLRHEHLDSLSSEAVEAFDDLIDALKLFGPAREHFKTLYFRWELVNLSRYILYTAVPALFVSAAMILYLDDPGSLGGAMIGVSNLVWLVSASVAVALLPFMLLLSYVLRIATVAKRTLAVGPIVLRETKHTSGDQQTD